MIPANLNSILEFMRNNQFEVDIQQETQQIFTIIKMNQREYPLFIRLFEESQHVQLLVFIPSPLKPEMVSDMGRFLHLLNKELDLPGFGMDEIAGVVFYRLMIPALKKKIDEELFLAYLKTIKNVCQLFAPPIEAVSQGHTTLDEIIQKVQESEQKSK